ncbi:MAG: glycoside hydrolase family 5 protein [Treponema sp.]|nr:glycoside hydrolase family 5 protein [Treponema sp.]
MKKSSLIVKKLSAILLSAALVFTGCDLLDSNSRNNSNTQTEETSTQNDESDNNDDDENTDSDGSDTSDTSGSGNTDTEGSDSSDTSGSDNTDTEGSDSSDTSGSDNTDTTSSLDTSLSSIEFAKKLVIGWNLGNTLDATDSNTNYGAGTETSWGMPKTTAEMLDAVKAAGFETIRIPVSWHNHVSTDGNYTINSEWMARVKEIVDWAIEDGFYVILNIHHDNFSTTDIASNPGFALSLDDTTIQTKSKAYLEKVWTQIANTFNNDYDEKLIFEVLNEPRDVGSSYEWYFSSSSLAKEYCDVITDYENTCIEAIRATGGNNANRYIMVPGYAASGSDTTMLGAYTMPEEPEGSSASDKLILSTHAYSPYNFAMANEDSTFDSSDESSLTSLFNYLNTNYISRGIGVVMGEASASNKDNTDERIKWVNSYFGKAKEIGIPVVLWDNMIADADGNENTASGYNGEHHGWLNRNTCEWYFPTIIEAMMTTVGVTDYSIPEYEIPTTSSIGWDSSKAKTVNSSTAELGWNNDYKLDKSYFSSATEGSILKITFENSGAAFKIINSSWTTYFEGQILNGSVNTSSGVITATASELYYVLTASDATAWKSQDIYLAGQNGTVTGVYFQE